MLCSSVAQADSGWNDLCRSGIAAPVILGVTSYVSGHFADQTYSFKTSVVLGAALVGMTGAYKINNLNHHVIGACVASPIVGYGLGHHVDKGIRYYCGCSDDDYRPRHHGRRHHDEC